MRNVRDTFLHFIADNIVDGSNNPIPVHNVRRDINDPRMSELQENAVNIQFLTDDFDIHVGITQVSIDVIHDNELTAVDWTRAVWQVISAAFMTPKMDYSSGTPVPLGTNIYWKRSAKFRQVKNDFYYHFTCLLTLNHHPY